MVCCGDDLYPLGETYQVLHLVVRAPILQVSEVHGFVWCPTEKLPINSWQGGVEHVSSLHILFAGNQPRLEQVLVKAVPQCPDRYVPWSKGKARENKMQLSVTDSMQALLLN